jgi:cytochrome P450
VITLTTFDEAREAFRSRDLRQALYDEGERLMAGVIVNLHGAAHIARRRLENRLFRRDTFAWYEADRIPAIIDAVLAPAIESGEGDLLPLARTTMLQLSTEVAGIDVAAGDHGELARFATLMERLARASTVAHATGDKAAIISDGDAALHEFERDFFHASWRRRTALVDQARRGELDPTSLPRDVLTTLVHNQDQLDLHYDTVLREVAYFPWVGSHSTSTQLVHAMHHMFEWIVDHPDQRPLLVSDHPFRQRFVHESMRLHPASPVALRVATGDVPLRSGRVLGAGTAVVIDVERANRDTRVFGPNADLFDPSRQPADGVPPWGLSFGTGTHACLGQELASGLEFDAAVEHHLLGSVTLMAGTMLRAGARPHRSRAPVADAATTRRVWASYPVEFRPVEFRPVEFGSAR